MPKFYQWIARALVVFTVLLAGNAMAQSEPSMAQIYAAAQAGKLDEAQVMVQQVLVSHPKSAKAHFIRAELYARQGQLGQARESLATAESIAPGLPFAKPEAVQALRTQLAARPTSPVTVAHTAPAAQAPATSSWLLPLTLAGGVIFAGYLFFRRRAVPAYEPAMAYPAGNGLSGPQTFGAGVGTVPAGYPQGYPQSYPQQAGPGLGSRIAGGVATGLAVGAGVMAAEAIGRNLMGHQGNSNAQADAFNPGYEPLAGNVNTDMGGNNFGISDTSWDDGGSADAGGGGDWDN